jgi:uncharacterized protein YegP (UPF0339 family)
MPAEFEIFVGDDGEHHWRYQAGNGEIVAQSEAYSSKQACRNGIDSIKEGATNAPVRDTTTAGE